VLSRSTRLLERLDRSVRLVFLEEADAGIDQQHDDNDGQIIPPLGHARKNGRDFNHPWDRSPKIAKEFA
jgi:hypothetical protein